jgi:hypothetical protein
VTNYDFNVSRPPLSPSRPNEKKEQRKRVLERVRKQRQVARQSLLQRMRGKEGS